MGLLDGKSGIVTGAAQGFGLATARRLAEEGAAVALVDIKADKVNAAAASLVSEGLNAIAVKADVSDENATIRMLDEAEQAFGKLNFIHQNAAIQVEKLLHETTLDEWVNLDLLAPVIIMVLDQGLVTKKSIDYTTQKLMASMIPCLKS